MRNVIIVIALLVGVSTNAYAWDNHTAWKNTGLITAGAVGAWAIDQAWHNRHDDRVVIRESYPVYYPQQTIVYQPQPVIVPQYSQVIYPQVQAPSRDETIMVGITTTSGVVFYVNLRRENGGYVGPQNEFYPTFPTIDTLRAIYGR
jgi:hypothetical protein